MTAIYHSYLWWHDEQVFPRMAADTWDIAYKTQGICALIRCCALLPPAQRWQTQVTYVHLTFGLSFRFSLHIYYNIDFWWQVCKCIFGDVRENLEYL